MAASTPTSKVSTRTFSLLDLVQRVWKEEWNKPEKAYEFKNGRKFDSTDRQTTGIYTRG